MQIFNRKSNNWLKLNIIDKKWGEIEFWQFLKYTFYFDICLNSTLCPIVYAEKCIKNEFKSVNIVVSVEFFCFSKKYEIKKLYELTVYLKKQTKMCKKFKKS